MTFTKQHAERLLTLAYFLKTEVPRRYFDMGAFVDRHGDGATAEDAKSLVTSEPACGTTACAAGWCPVVFPRDWKWHSVWFDGIENAFPSLRTNTSIDENTWLSLEEYFGLEARESDTLFGPDEKRTPKQEAKVIEKFVESKGYVYAESVQ